MSSTVDSGNQPDDVDPFAEFARENRDWLEEKADSDLPGAWVAQALLDGITEEG